jgi:hypothetical protein
MIGVRDLPSQTLIQPGVRISFAATSRTALNVDLRDSINLTGHYSAGRWVAGVSHKFTDHFTGELAIDGTSRTNSVISLNGRYRW